MKRKIKSSSLLSAASLLIAGIILPVVALAAPVITKYTSPSANPQDMMTATDGHIWYSESSAGKVAILDSANPSAPQVEVTTGAGPNQLSQGGNTVYVAEFGANAILPIDATSHTAGTAIDVGSSAHLINACTGTSSPVGVAVDTGVSTNPPIWFTEFGAASSVPGTQGCVGVLTNSGSGYTFTDEYVLPAGFTAPGKILYADNQIWITARGQGMLEIPQSQADSPPPCNATNPTCVATPIVSTGTGFQASTNMQGLAYDPFQHLVYFADNTNGKIGVLNAASPGTVCYYNLSPSDGLDDLTFGPDNRIWFTESQSNKIGSITAGDLLCDGTLADTYVSDAGVTVSGANGITASGTSSSDGSIWFSEAQGNKIDQLTLASLTSTPPPPPPPGGGTTGGGSGSGSGSGGSGTTAAPKTPNTGLAALAANPLGVLFSSVAAASFLVAIAYRLKPVKQSVKR